MPESAPGPDQAIPVTLLTGALGAGKTSLLNTLLTGQMPEGTAVIVNELGDIAVDGALVVDINGPLVVLAGGCLCCAVRGALVDTLRDLFLKALRREIPPIRHLLVETTGLALIPPLRHALSADFFVVQRFRLSSVITVVDVGNLPDQLATLPEVRDQIVQADVLVLGKTDLAPPDDVTQVRETLRSLNPLAPIHDRRDLPSATRLLAPAEASGPRIYPLSPAHGTDVHSMVLVAPEPLPWGAFVEALDGLLAAQGDWILRLKGWLPVRGLPGLRIVQAVHHRRYPSVDLPEAPGVEGQLVVIWRGLAPEQITSPLSAWFRRSEDAA